MIPQAETPSQPIARGTCSQSVKCRVAPYLAVNALAVSGFGALVAATAVLQLLAVERETKSRLPLRQIGWCAAVAAVLSVSYVSFHPLQSTVSTARRAPRLLGGQLRRRLGAFCANSGDRPAAR